MSSPTASAARSRRATRPVPELSDAYAPLDLDGLRAYRSQLQDEESRVSYWRRILQARLDVVRAAAEGTGDGSVLGTGGGFDAERLGPVLTDERLGGGRAALVEVLPVDDIPPLPSLAGLWARRVEPGDVAGAAALAEDLQDAEEQLSSYRTALHERLAQTTDELIARYRATPALALTALPLRRPGAARVPAPRRAG